MLNTDRECRETLQLFTEARQHGQDVCDQVGAQLRDEYLRGHIRNFSIQRVFENTVTDDHGDIVGHNVVRRMREERHRGGVLLEAGGDTLTTANFSNIIGQMNFGMVLQAFDNVDFIAGNLLTQIPAETQMPIMVPGIVMIGDVAQKVGEGEEYPVVGFGSQFITLPRIDKEGFILEITEEAIREDKTGQIMEAFNNAAQSMALTVEKERLNVILGITSTYSRNGGPVQATYADTHTQGDFDNLVAGNALVDYTNIQASDNAFAAVNDPDTGEPVPVSAGADMVVPRPLFLTAWRTMNADLVKTGNLTAGQVMVQSGNPLNASRTMQMAEPWTSPYVGSIVGNNTSWFRGDFKRAFVERVYWETQVYVEDRNSGVGFSRDIVNRTKVRRKAVTAVRDPRFVQKDTP